MGKLLSSLGEDESNVASFEDTMVERRVGELIARSATASPHPKRRTLRPVARPNPPRKRQGG